MKKQKKEKIQIPEGCFEGYCGGCIHAKRKFQNSKGEIVATQEGQIFCKHHGKIYPESDHGYECYVGRIVTWLGIIVATWFTLLVLSVALGI